MMWANYLKTAVRNQLRNKAFSAINISGLVIGLTACLFIYQFVSFEWSYDRFHSKSDQIYRVIDDVDYQGKQIQHGTMTYPAVGALMAKDYEEIALHTRMLVPFGESIVKANNQVYLGDKCLFVDEHFLSVFDFPLVAGQPSVLQEKYTAILSESMAKKYFGQADAQSLIGKEFFWSTEPTPYTVKAIAKDVPENSHLQFDVLISYASLYHPDNRSFEESLTEKPYVRHYLLLHPETDDQVLEEKFIAFSQRYFTADKAVGKVHAFTLQPLKQVHLYSDYAYEYAQTSSGKVVWATVWIAGIILVIAWINYINLTTSRSLDRAKEVGVRKVMGANARQLLKQFVFESVLVTTLALLAAVLLVLLLQKPFNAIVDGDRSLWTTFAALDPKSIIILVAASIIGLALSGFYPAFILSSFQPVTVLKGKFQRSAKGQFMRKILVVFQFTAACALVTATFMVSRQMEFMRKKDMGIAIGNTMVVSPPMRTLFDSTYQGRMKTFKHALQDLSQVVSVTTSSQIPGARPYTTSDIRLNEGQERYTANQLVVDEDFFTNYEVKLLAGRTFAFSDCNFDWNKVKNIIINRSAMSLFGLNTENVLDAKIYIGDKEWTVVGVVENFHQQSLHTAIEPMLFTPDYGPFNPTSVKLTGGDHPASIREIKTLFEKFFPDNAFQYYFLEDQFNKQYNDDRKFSTLTKVFTILSVIISCLGLIGLSTYTAIQRTKEIGIRKVLGASVMSIIALLSIDFIKLVLVAVVLSVPLAYFGMEEWLSRYAYRINPGVLVYVMPMGGILLIAAGTICGQVLKTAKRDPVSTLKYE
ncbi:putative ABC transport system permease protein [Chryseolinea serpens]|uniref:Putative ABC transport system permease protein n=1 Tax=Chryseolinea serpens TaxID=947013 RepID=A0A1M5QKF9_9BACT|nr:ABC transporter permease [Chryseolinea serpens]SHH14240.1 putative ABC transport system permease protein [Chryseolinea serpens]